MIYLKITHIHYYRNLYMIVVLVCYFFALLHCQVNPVWEESPYMETKVVTIVDNHQKTSGTYYQTSTYTKPLNNAQVCLCNSALIQQSYKYGQFLTLIHSVFETLFLPFTVIDSPISQKYLVQPKYGTLNFVIWLTMEMQPIFQESKQSSQILLFQISTLVLVQSEVEV